MEQTYRDGLISRQAGGWTDSQTDVKMDREEGRLVQGQTDIQTDAKRQTNKQAGWQMDRHTETDI